MKKIIFSLLTIISLFFIIENVSALSLGAPSAAIAFNRDSNQSMPGLIEYSNWLGLSGYRFNQTFQFDYEFPNTACNQFYFVYNELNLCSGINCILKGAFQIFDYGKSIGIGQSDWVLLDGISVFLEDTSNGSNYINCSNSISFSDNFYYTINFECPINNLKKGNFVMNLNSKPLFSHHAGGMYVGLATNNFSIIENPNQGDVITNQNNNTNSIIGNAAQNTTNIINNQIQNKDDILNNQNNNTNSIIGNAAQNTTEIINNQIKNNEELKNTINDNFNNCRDSKNLLDTPYLENNKLNYTATKDDDYKSTDFYAYLEAGKQYTFSVETTGTFGNRNDDTEIYLLFDKKYDYIIHMDSKNGYTFIPNRTGNYYIRYDVNKNGDTQSFWNFQIIEGTQNIPFEKYGEKICSNKIDETNKNLEEAEKTRKGILGTLKSVAESIIQLPTKIVTFLIEKLTDLLKLLFIPGDNFLNNWFNDLKSSFEQQLGFLSYPITWILEILNKFLTLNDTGHYIISWSAIKVPNFDFNIIESGSFDLASLLQNSTIKSFHDMYLVIVDALMLLAFMNLCLNVYNRIIGGDVDNYEYISVDEGYNIDVETGEVKSQWTRQRRTRKERIK